MALDDPNKIDAAGIETESGLLVLTIADAWDWLDERGHLAALQAKLNAYINSVESGQVWATYPNLKQGLVLIDVVGRFAMPPSGDDFIKRVSEISADFGVQIRKRTYPGNP